MIGTEESNNETMRMNAYSIICDKNKEFKFKGFSEECFKMCSCENIQTGVKGELIHKKIQYFS